MCGRYTLLAAASRLEERFDATLDHEHRQRYNAAPGQSLPVILNDDETQITTATWGLRPEWAEESEGLINARAETLAEKPTFRDAFEQRRCLVPVDGFYEWVDEDGRRVPYRVTFRDDRTVALAGLWDRWVPETSQAGLTDFGSTAEPGDPEPVTTFTIVTIEPNELVSDLHHRMPAVLSMDAEDDWLTADHATAGDLLKPYPAREMEAYRVSDAVNDPSNDRPDLIDPVET